ncbi:hypothetical protein N7466_003553 [Penicillium verhagenii]|uniref:uncharacterized protein n=1 Tax=Penicillium verhagenii TaxID=1562060 RepID=UPI0025459B87|nr:uncharacterized protein N7466_003553 [Penicillium verhagenii]KAJ5937103.1 hypothetical protein N7466_003553 [Penicillium verhagenii]
MTNVSISTDPAFLTDETLHETYELDIADRRGEHVRFGELVAGKGDSRLLDTIPHHAKPAQIIIIGCGDHTLIGPYMEEVSEEFPIYTDPSGTLQEKLQMTRTWDGFNEPPPYSSRSFPNALFNDLKQRWKRGWGALKGGPGNQQGGEWIFQKGKLKYAHRMQATNDHLTATQLLDILKMDVIQDQDQGPSTSQVDEGQTEDAEEAQKPRQQNGAE